MSLIELIGGGIVALILLFIVLGYNGLIRKRNRVQDASAQIDVLKFITFSYFILAYVSRYPMVYAYVLMAALVVFIVARGAAEVYESTRK